MTADPSLTARQQQAWALVAQGFTNKAIAGKLAISHRRVTGLIAVVAHKLGCTGHDRDERVELAKRWLREHGDPAPYSDVA